MREQRGAWLAVGWVSEQAKAWLEEHGVVFSEGGLDFPVTLTLERVGVDRFVIVEAGQDTSAGVCVLDNSIDYKECRIIWQVGFQPKLTVPAEQGEP